MAKINWDKGMNDWLKNDWNPAPNIQVDGLENDERAQTPSVQQYKAVNNDTPTYNNKTSYNAPVNQQAQQPQSNIFKNLFNAIFHANENPDGMFEDNAQKSSSFLGSVGQGLLKGAGEFDKSIFDLLNLADKPRQILQNKLGIQGPDTVKNYLDNTRGQFDNTINDSNHYIAGASLPDKAAFNISALIPQTIGALTTFKAPIPKMGNLGEGLNAGIGQPVENALSFLGNSKAAGIGKEAIKQGSEMAAYNIGTTAANNIGNNENNNLANAGLQGFAGGALFGTGGKLLGDILAKRGGLKPGTPNVNPINPIETPKQTPDIMPNEPQVTPSLENNIKPPTNKTMAANIEYPDNNYNISSVGDLIGKPLKSNPNDNNLTLKESQFKTNTLKNASMLQQKDTQNMIDNINSWYEVKPNARSMDNAYNELQTNPQAVIDRIKNSESLNSAEDAAAAGLITNNLRQEAAQTGDYTKLKDWLETVQPKVTSTAQSLQAISTWKNLTPEGALIKAQQVVGKVNRDGLKEFGKKFQKVELTTDEMKFINDKMTEIDGMSDGRKKDIEFAKVKQLIANKIPPTFADKLNSWRRISMLLNPKTMVRNTLGNTVMSGLENVKDLAATPLDKLVSLKTGERTTTLPNLFTQAKGFVKGAKETVQDAKAGVNTSPTLGQFEIPQAQAFRKGVLSKLESATNTGLTLGDRPFYQAAYDDALRQQMKINKVNTPTEDMINKATEVAKDRTFQNESLISKSFDGLRKNLNQLGAGMGMGNEQTGIGNAVLPFTHTPANILDKAIDYSPIGTIKGIAQLVSKKEFNQKQFVDRIGRSLTGTALIALGADLAKQGLITGAANKDKDVATLEKQVGMSPYAFKTGNTYRTFDWAQPASTPLAIGADMYNQYKDSKNVKNAIGEAMLSGGSTLFNQSLLQGVQKFFGGTGTGTNNILSNASSAGQSFITSLIPTTSKQLTQLVDEKQRDTSGGLKDQLLSRIPFASKSLPAKVDTMGNDMLQYQGDNNSVNIFLNPGYTTKYNPSSGEKLALDIYNNTGEKSQFPRVAPDKITYKDANNQSQTLMLTPGEKQKLQQLMGSATEQAYNDYTPGSDNTQTIKDLQKILTDISTKSKNQLLQDKSIQTYVKPTKKKR